MTKRVRGVQRRVVERRRCLVVVLMSGRDEEDGVEGSMFVLRFQL